MSPFKKLWKFFLIVPPLHVVLSDLSEEKYLDIIRYVCTHLLMNSPAADALILQPQWTSSGKLNINFKEFLWWFMLYNFRSVVKFYFLSLNHSWSLTNPACSLMTVIIQLDTTEQKSFVVRDFYRNTDSIGPACPAGDWGYVKVSEGMCPCWIRHWSWWRGQNWEIWPFQHTLIV